MVKSPNSEILRPTVTIHHSFYRSFLQNISQEFPQDFVRDRELQSSPVLAKLEPESIISHNFLLNLIEFTHFFPPLDACRKFATQLFQSHHLQMRLWAILNYTLHF